MHRLIYYPGHLGKAPVTSIEANRAVRWDRDVKLLPAVAAAGLLKNGFLPAATLKDAAAHYGVTQKRIGSCVASGELRSAVYEASERTLKVMRQRGMVAAMRTDKQIPVVLLTVSKGRLNGLRRATDGIKE